MSTVPDHLIALRAEVLRAEHEIELAAMRQTPMRIGERAAALVEVDLLQHRRNHAEAAYRIALGQFLNPAPKVANADAS